MSVAFFQNFRSFLFCFDNSVDPDHGSTKFSLHTRAEIETNWLSCRSRLDKILKESNAGFLSALHYLLVL